MTNSPQQRGAQPQTQALSVTPIETSTQAIALVPQSLDGAMQLARWLATSSFLPDKLRGKEGDIFCLVLAGVELGLPPMAALRGLYIVNGKTAMESKTKAAICIQRGAALYFKRTEYTNLATTWETWRKGETEARTMRYTRKEAEEAGLLRKEGPWQSYTQRMISHRALGWLCDDAYPDVVLGVATAEDFEGEQITFQPIASLGGGVEVGHVTSPTPPAAGAAPAASPVAQSSAPAAARPAAPPAPEDKRPLTEDEAIELMTAIGKCGTVAALKEVGRRIPYATMDEAERAKWAKIYEDQRGEILRADAAEKGATTP